MMLTLILLGVAAGVLSGMFGIGGGIVIVPSLVFLFQFSQITATATSLVAMLLPVGIFGVIHYYQSGILNKTTLMSGGFIAVGLFLGVFLGARVATSLPPIYLKRAFSVFLIFVAYRLWTS